MTAGNRAIAVRMAPQIDAAYERLEKLIGADFNARFYKVRDELIATLEPSATNDE